MTGPGLGPERARRALISGAAVPVAAVGDDSTRRWTGPRNQVFWHCVDVTAGAALLGDGADKVERRFVAIFATARHAAMDRRDDVGRQLGHKLAERTRCFAGHSLDDFFGAAFFKR